MSSRSHGTRPAAAPVEVVYYPKRGPVPARRPTVETVITHEAPVEEPRRRTARGVRGKTLTDERLDPEAEAQAGLSRLGHALFEAGDLDSARTIFGALVVLGRPDAFPHTMLGTIALSAGASQAALEHFEAALAIDPGELAALVYRAELRLTGRRSGRAVEDLQQALRLGPAGDPFVERARRLLRLATASSRSGAPGLR